MNKRVVVVLPAYNAEKTIAKTFSQIPKSVAQKIIVVDDCSKDKTVAVAKRLKCLFYRHTKNRGYGANQKTCYTLAMKHHADIVVMLHPDYQYDPRLVPHLVNFIKNGYFDIMLGSRIRTRKESLAGGMPKYKYYANRLLTIVLNVATGQNLGEWHTGMRAYSVRVLKTVKYKNFSNDFVFDIQMLLAAAKLGYKIGDIPVPVRYLPDSSSINFKRSCLYGISTLKEVLRYTLARNYYSK